MLLLLLRIAAAAGCCRFGRRCRGEPLLPRIGLHWLLVLVLLRLLRFLLRLRLLLQLRLLLVLRLRLLLLRYSLLLLAAAAAAGCRGCGRCGRCGRCRGGCRGRGCGGGCGSCFGCGCWCCRSCGSARSCCRCCSCRCRPSARPPVCPSTSPLVVHRSSMILACIGAIRINIGGCNTKAPKTHEQGGRGGVPPARAFMELLLCATTVKVSIHCHTVSNAPDLF